MKEWFKDLWYWVCKNILILLSDKRFIWFASWITYNRLGFKWYRFNISNPSTFNEKLNFLKINRQSPLAMTVADKVAVRTYVKEKVGEEILIPLFGVYTQVKDVNFESLPQQFALKVNHGSGWNIICTDKSELNENDIKKDLRKWMSRNAWYLSRERQYKEIKSKIICEELLGENILDYKFFCANGEPFAIQVDTDRFGNHQRAIYDCEWQLLSLGINYACPEKKIPEPKHLDLMLRISESLAGDFEFCRIDLYEVDFKIYFGEITLCPGGGFEPFHSYQQDLEFGKHLDIKL